MTNEEIHTKLCFHDPRNPNYNELDSIRVKETWKSRKYVPEQCYCDNCFYGRTELAEQLLLLKNNNTVDPNLLDDDELKRLIYEDWEDEIKNEDPRKMVFKYMKLMRDKFLKTIQ